MIHHARLSNPPPSLICLDSSLHQQFLCYLWVSMFERRVVILPSGILDIRMCLPQGAKGEEIREERGKYIIRTCTNTHTVR